MLIKKTCFFYVKKPTMNGDSSEYTKVASIYDYEITIDDTKTPLELNSTANVKGNHLAGINSMNCIGAFLRLNKITFFSGCLGKAALFYCDTPWTFHVSIL